MGALHAGHRELLLSARSLAGENGIVAASIFLNPIQFDNPVDLASYPRNLNADLALCEQAGVDYVFAPTAAAMYENDRSINVDEHSLSLRLCGATRPGHFSGVCTVVLKLFNIVSPTHAVFGKKDYQQLAIIRRMVRDLNIPVVIHGVETVRESDGLAFSSRNARLTPENRNNAPVIRRALLEASAQYRQGVSLSEILDHTRKMISGTPGTRLDYVEIVHAGTLVSLEEGDRLSPALMAVAVFFGDVRLIDNIEL